MGPSEGFDEAVKDAIWESNQLLVAGVGSLKGSKGCDSKLMD